MSYKSMQDNEKVYNSATYDSQIQQPESKTTQETNSDMQRAPGYDQDQNRDYAQGYNHGYNQGYNHGYYNQGQNHGYDHDYNQNHGYNHYPNYNSYYNQYSYNPFFPLFFRY